jgi:dTDP-4-amino-4,6-dideoxygalactose transaminase
VAGCVSIPVHQYLSSSDVSRVIEAVQESMGG